MGVAPDKISRPGVICRILHPEATETDPGFSEASSIADLPVQFHSREYNNCSVLCYATDQPPSTNKFTPVTRADAGEARNTTAPVTSDVSPILPSGMWPKTWA